MSTIKISRPKYNYYVQITDHSELVQDTIDFLESHATKPLNEISIEEINTFLADCWGRARWAGEGLSADCKVPSC